MVVAVITVNRMGDKHLIHIIEYLGGFSLVVVALASRLSRRSLSDVCHT